MRRPDQYPEMSRIFRNTIFSSIKNEENGSVFIEESRKWSDDTKDVVKQLAEAIHSLAVDYSWLLQSLYWLEYHFKALTFTRNLFE